MIVQRFIRQNAFQSELAAVVCEWVCWNYVLDIFLPLAAQWYSAYRLFILEIVAYFWGCCGECNSKNFHSQNSINSLQNKVINLFNMSFSNTNWNNTKICETLTTTKRRLALKYHTELSSYTLAKFKHNHTHHLHCTAIHTYSFCVGILFGGFYLYFGILFAFSGTIW